jgi:hypothetical protein
LAALFAWRLGLIDIWSMFFLYFCLWYLSKCLCRNEFLFDSLATNLDTTTNKNTHPILPIREANIRPYKYYEHRQSRISPASSFDISIMVNPTPRLPAGTIIFDSYDFHPQTADDEKIFHLHQEIHMKLKDYKHIFVDHTSRQEATMKERS